MEEEEELAVPAWMESWEVWNIEMLGQSERVYPTVTIIIYSSDELEFYSFCSFYSLCSYMHVLANGSFHWPNHL